MTSTDKHFEGAGASTGVRVLPRTSGTLLQPDSDPQFDTLLEPADQTAVNTRQLDFAPVSERPLLARPRGAASV